MTPATGFTSYADALLAALARDPSRPAVTGMGARRRRRSPPAPYTPPSTAWRRCSPPAASAAAAPSASSAATAPRCSPPATPPTSSAPAWSSSTTAWPPRPWPGSRASAETALLLVDPALHDTARDAARTTPAGPLPEVMTLGARRRPTCGARPARPPAPRSRATPEVPSAARPEDDWCIRHTGGTTGIPKGVRMAHAPYAGMLIAPPHGGRRRAAPLPRLHPARPPRGHPGRCHARGRRHRRTAPRLRPRRRTRRRRPRPHHPPVAAAPAPATASSTTPPSPPPTSAPSPASPTAAARPRPPGWRRPPRSSARCCSGCTAVRGDVDHRGPSGGPRPDRPRRPDHRRPPAARRRARHPGRGRAGPADGGAGRGPRTLRGRDDRLLEAARADRAGAGRRRLAAHRRRRHAWTTRAGSTSSTGSRT